MNVVTDVVDLWFLCCWPVCMVMVMMHVFFLCTCLSTIGDQAFPVVRYFPAVEHSATERHIIAITDCFQDTPEELSVQPFLFPILRSATARAHL